MKRYLLATLVFAIYALLSYFWLNGIFYILILILGFAGAGGSSDGDFKGCFYIVSVSLLAIVALAVPGLLFEYEENLIASILLVIYYFVLMYFVRRSKKEDEIFELKRNELKSKFGGDYFRYIDKTDEEINEIIKQREYNAYCIQKEKELSPVINNTYIESEINSLLDTFFVLDKYVYIAGLSHSYSESDVKKYIKERKLSFSVDKQAQYVIDYFFNEPCASNAKITIKINEEHKSIEKISFSADLQTYSEIEEKLDNYIELLLESTMFKIRSDAEDNNSSLYCKHLTNSSNEFFLIDITINEETNDKYKLLIELSATIHFLTYVGDMRYILDLRGSAKERIRKHTTIPQVDKEAKTECNPKNEKCYVYLMVDTTNNFHKIGISNNPEYREKTLQSEKPTIELICAKEYPHRKIAESIEKALHSSFAEKRIRGEWFNLDSNEVDMIKSTLQG